jgi:cell division protein FtsQ
MSRPGSAGVLPAEPRLKQRAQAQRQARRASWLRRSGWVVAGVAPFVLVAWVLLGSSWLVVDKVVVTGESRVTAAQVLAAADVRLGTPLARVDTGAVAARVRRLGPVASVSVTRSWPGTLRVTVVEREPVVAIGKGRSWTLLDSSGTRLGTASAVPAGLVRLEVTNPGPGDAPTRAALTVLQGLPKALRSLVVVVRAPSVEQVGFVLRDGRRVVWGGTSDGATKAAALTALLRLKGHLFDVSSPSVVTRS